MRALVLAALDALCLAGPAFAQDLDATQTPPGFAYPIVPYDSAGGTWFKWGVQQTGVDPFPAWGAELRRDGELLFTKLVPAGGVAGWHEWLRQGPVSMRGGRHTLTSIADIGNAVSETDEGNNSFSQQFVWPSLVVGINSAIQQPAPPEWGSFPQPNVVAYTSGPGSFPWVVSVAPLDMTDDYDLLAYQGASLSVGGGNSFWRGPGTDLLVYPQSISVPQIHVGVARYSAGGAGDFLIDFANAFGRVQVSPGNYSFPSQVLSANRLAEIYQFYPAPSQRCFVTLRTPEGADDLAFVIDVSPTADKFTSGRSRALSSASSVPLSASIDTARHSSGLPVNVVVFRTDGDRTAEPVPYALEWNVFEYVGVEDGPLAGRLALSAAPNPVRAEARFLLDLPAAGGARLVVYDARGRMVARAFDGELPAGPSTVRWAPGGDVRPGMYFAELAAGGRTARQRFVVLR